MKSPRFRGWFPLPLSRRASYLFRQPFAMDEIPLRSYTTPSPIQGLESFLSYRNLRVHLFFFPVSMEPGPSWTNWPFSSSTGSPPRPLEPARSSRLLQYHLVLGSRSFSGARIRAPCPPPSISRTFVKARRSFFLWIAPSDFANVFLCPRDLFFSPPLPVVTDLSKLRTYLPVPGFSHCLLSPTRAPCGNVPYHAEGPRIKPLF